MPLYALGDMKPLLPVDSAFWIGPRAHVMGNVRLERDVAIWFGAVLRGYNELIDVGEGTNIQAHAMVHADPGFPKPARSPSCSSTL